MNRNYKLIPKDWVSASPLPFVSDAVSAYWSVLTSACELALGSASVSVWASAFGCAWALGSPYESPWGLAFGCASALGSPYELPWGLAFGYASAWGSASVSAWGSASVSAWVSEFELQRRLEWPSVSDSRPCKLPPTSPCQRYPSRWPDRNQKRR